MTRKPVVAGSFYPGDKENLTKQINDFLSRAKKIETDKKLKMIIVPHAGYDYSGQTAAWGFKQLENRSDQGNQEYQRVILMGSSHRNWFDKAAVYNRGFWETPLGKVKIDAELAKKIINESNFIEANTTVHQNEHSLEVELPFLQQVLDNFKVVPILLSRPETKVLEALARVVAKHFDEKTLVVISTDLSHYPSYAIARQVDKKTIEGILSGDGEKFNQIIRKNEMVAGVETAACGATTVRVGLLIAKALKLNEIKLIHYKNSGDVTGDQSRVVGYAAIGFYKNAT